MEVLDIYDWEGRPTGQTHTRGQPLSSGQFLFGTAVWVVTPRQEILVTLRDRAKQKFPNTWENPGGALIAGESSRQAVARELAEETGIVAPPQAFDFLCKSLNGPLHFDSYGLRKDISLADIVLREGETAKARLVTLDQWREMLLDNAFAAPIEKEIYEHWDTYWKYLSQTT